jgi:hypothetical protein
MNPGVLKDGKSVSLTWTRNFLKEHCNMSFKRVNGKTFKLPKDWERQRYHMSCRVAYFMKLYNVPAELVVNSDQTGIHLVPNTG